MNQKNFRDFTIGELIDSGYLVEIKYFQAETVKQGKQFTQLFEGTKQSTNKINPNLTTTRAWTSNFTALAYVRDNQ